MSWIDKLTKSTNAVFTMTSSTFCQPLPPTLRQVHRDKRFMHAVTRGLTSLFAAWKTRRELRKRRYDAKLMGELSLHVMRDLNAQDWAHGRTLERREMERYDRARASMPFRHIL